MRTSLGVFGFVSPIEVLGFGWRGACLWQLGQGFSAGVKVTLLAVSLARGCVI